MATGLAANGRGFAHKPWAKMVTEFYKSYVYSYIHMFSIPKYTFSEGAGLRCNF